jgi:hypothetical protein
VTREEYEEIRREIYEAEERGEITNVQAEIMRRKLERTWQTESGRQKPTALWGEPPGGPKSNEQKHERE